MAERPVWLIGCGNMAGAMLAGWLAAGEDPGRFHVIDPGAPDLPEGVSRVENAPAVGFGAAIVQLGVKPHMLSDIASQIGEAVGPQTVLTSIMAGVEIASLRRAFPDAAEIFRTMPNLPVALGKGAIGLLPERESGSLDAEIVELLTPLGAVERLATEAALGAVTVLSGSGPAFLYRFADALAAAGEAAGLDRKQALRLAIATVEGASALAARSDESPGALADRVASPGGTTRAGLDILDRDAGLETLIRETIDAAVRRAEEMAEEARG